MFLRYSTFKKCNLFNLPLTTISTNKNGLRTCPHVSLCLNRKEDKDFKLPINTFTRTFATEPLPRHKDLFGDLSGKNYRKVQMDPDEEAEEKFTESEGRVPLRFQKSPKEYADLIKSYLAKTDLVRATSVLDLAKSNRDKPTVYMFTLLMRAYALNGDMKMCFRLYNKMKKFGLKPNPAAHTSLINSIANFKDSEHALEMLYQVRKIFIEKQIELNDTHYNALIMAYGRHNKVQEAFTLVDEMRDKKLPVYLPTFNVLLMCAVSKKKEGLRLGLLVWHMMRRFNIKPDIKTYNLLLRCIRDTSLGELKVNDVLLTGQENSRVQLTNFGRPNLLACPPVVTEVPVIEVIKSKKEEEHERKKQESRKKKKEAAKLEDKNKIEKEKSEILIVDDDKSLVLQESIPSIDLNEIHKKNKLILFGGFENMLNLMKLDEVEPDVKTFTYLMELSPDSVVIEDIIIQLARKSQVQLDVSFFNILMRKRCFRHQYDSARDVLMQMERSNLYPDHVTWGTLALTCDTPAQINQFLETMESLNIAPDNIIIGILLVKASRSKKKEKFNIMIDLMKYMMTNEITPSKITIEKLDEFQREMKQLIKNKDKTIRSIRFKELYTKYANTYDKWRTKIGPKKIIHET